MGFKAITQIILTVISLVIIFTYIKPTLFIIRSTQDEIFQYGDAVAKEEDLSDTLSGLLGVMNSFSSSNLASLYEYLPEEVDALQVMADIASIAESNSIRLTDISAGEIELPLEGVVLDGEKKSTEQTSSLDFDLKLSGAYENLKAFLKDIEQNKYPLEVIHLSFGSKVKNEEGVSEILVADEVSETYQLVLRAYAYSNSAPLN